MLVPMPMLSVCSGTQGAAEPATRLPDKPLQPPFFAFFQTILLHLVFNLYLGACPSAPFHLGMWWIHGGGSSTWRRLSSTGPHLHSKSLKPPLISFFKIILVHLVLNPRVGAHPSLPSAQERVMLWGLCVGCLMGHVSSLAQTASCAWG